MAFGDFLDRTIGVFSPRAGVRRQGYRAAMQIQREQRKANEESYRYGAHRAARSHRGNADWLTTSGSADADTLDDLDALRARSRDVAMNDGRGAGMLHTLVTSVIGTGIRPQAQLDHELLNIAEDQARDIERQMDRLWKRWARCPDAGKRLSFYSMQKTAYRAKKMNGEYIAIPQMIPRPRRPLDFHLQLIESDRLMTPFNKAKDPNFRSGVEIGKWGEPVRYWICKTHPGDDVFFYPRADEIISIPAEDARGRKLVFHEYDMFRVGQSRGIPAFSSVLDEFHDLDEYREAERYAMRLAACIGLIINEIEDTGYSGGGQITTLDGKAVEAFEPGMVWRGKNLDITQVNPQRPGTNFEAFLKDIDKTLGVSQGLTYELATKHFSDANYSSLRAAYVEARRYFQTEQQDHVAAFCQPSWEWVIEEAWLAGAIKLPVTAAEFYANWDLWTAALWVPMGFDWVDPMKEVSAEVKAVQANLSTHAEQIAKRTGGDWEATFRQRARENRRGREQGLITQAEEATVDTALSSLGLELSKADIRQRYGRPEPQGGDDIVNPPTPAPTTPQDTPPNE